MKRIFSLLGISVFLFACSSSLTVTSDYDKDADFNSYKTYRILPRNEDNKQIVNDIDWGRIERALTAEMDARGYTKVDSDPDIDVGVHIVLQNKTDVTAYTDYYGGYGYGRWGWGYGYGYGGGGGTARTTYSENTYTEGTAIINIMDLSTKKLIWQGVGVGTVNRDTEGREDRINKSVQKIMAGYPIEKPVPEKGKKS